MKVRRSGWGLILAVVAGYDLWALKARRPTLSAEFLEAVRHPRRRWFVIAAWGYLTVHLFGILPRRYDPLTALGFYLARHSR